ncbi:hypothetical protein K4I03_0153 [Streptococcus sanguinis]|nr:hypothetical protein [Streptococcus sanguinis]
MSSSGDRFRYLFRSAENQAMNIWSLDFEGCLFGEIAVLAVPIYHVS